MEPNTVIFVLTALLGQKPADLDAPACIPVMSDFGVRVLEGSCCGIHRPLRRISVRGIGGRTRLTMHELYTKLCEHWPDDLRDCLASLEAVQRADAYYRMGFPPNGEPTRLLILSESPAFTHDALLERKLQDEGVDAQETGHLNLVHCLSYGEPHLLDAAVEDVKLRRKVIAGTPIFWRVLSTLAGDLDPTATIKRKRSSRSLSLRLSVDDKLSTIDKDEFKKAFSHVVGGGSKKPDVRERRVQAKQSVLQRLRARGVVFADLCPLPIYTGGGRVDATNQTTGNVYWTPKKKLSSGAYRKIIRIAFQQYALPMIQELKPVRVVLLGKNLETALGRAVLAQSLPDGCELLNSMNHPSDINLAGVKYAPLLKRLRFLAMDDLPSAPSNEHGSVGVAAESSDSIAPRVKRRRLTR